MVDGGKPFQFDTMSATEHRDSVSADVDAAVKQHAAAPASDAEPPEHTDLAADLDVAIEGRKASSPREPEPEQEPEKSDRPPERPETKSDTKPEAKQAKAVEGDEQPWSAKNAAVMRSLPPAAQEHIRSMEKQTAEFAPVVKSFAPYTKEIESAGTTPAKLIEGWAKLESQMTGPGKDAAFAAIAYRYGVDLKQMVNEYSRMPKRFADAQQQQRTADERDIESALDAFAKNNEHFKALESSMAMLARSGVGAGKPHAERLKDLYSAAMWASPEHRQMMIDARNKAMSKPAPQVQPRTIRQELDAAMGRQINGRG